MSEQWTMPGWMEPYRDILEADLGGNTVENLLNDTTTNGFNNVIRAGLICMADSKVGMLHRLHSRGLLASVQGDEKGQDDESTDALSTKQER